jgi:hypothetical protein
MTNKETIISRSATITKVTNITEDEFKKFYLKKNEPVVLKGFAKDWDATKKWDFDYFLNLKENKSINLSVGDYIQDEGGFAKDTFKEYISKLKRESTNTDKKKTYLTALNIFDYYPELKHDANFSIFSKQHQLNVPLAWIGPSGTISGFHADHVNNMFSQIMGKKLFILASTSENSKMYPSKKYIIGATASRVDLNTIDLGKYPKFEKVKFRSVILEPGDVLFIPKKWWHYVESLDPSISISNFGYSKKELYTIAFFEQLKDVLHRRGYYKSKNCMCHKIVDGKRVMD